MDNQNQDLKLHKELSGSKRRSRLNLGIAALPNSGFFAGSNGSLGIIDMVCNEDAAVDNVALAHPVRYSRSSHKNQLAPPQKEIEIVHTEKLVLASDDTAALSSILEILGADKLSDDNRWKLLRRFKQLLAMRTVTPNLAYRLDLRRDWNQHRKVETLLDCFPSLKHSYSSLRGMARFQS